MSLNPFARHRLGLFRNIVLFCAGAGAIFQLSEEGWVVPIIGITIGVASGVMIALLDSTSFAARANRHPFWRALLIKSAGYLALSVLLALLAALIGGALQGLTMQDYATYISSGAVRIRALQIASLFVAVIFFRQMDRLLGPGRLWRYVTGRYHRPRRESRVFMFLDLKGSTEIAQRLSTEDYYDLLQSAFADLSEAVIATEAEIYQYVGDEAVLTWELQKGLKDANCIWVVALFEARLEQRRERYLEQFGLVPEFKAGVHAGSVLAAEIGDLRKDFVYTGDVLNATARIEGVCNHFGKRLIASKSLADQLPHIPAGFSRESLGEVELTGLRQPLELVALR